MPTNCSIIKPTIMRNILVTGAGGQLGREMRLAAEQAQDRYLFTDVEELDITDARAVMQAVETEHIGAIVNCAAYTDVERAEQEPETAERINRMAAANLAAAAARCDATLVHISTDYVFDGSGNVPYREQDATAPLGVYGRTKLAGEREVLASGCRHLILRTAWLYSPFGKNFCKTMLRLTAERPEVRVVFDQVGTPTYAADLAGAVTGILARGEDRMHGGLYHFSNEGVCSWYDFAHEIARLAGHDACRVLPCHTDEFPTGVQRPRYSVLDKSKIKDTFGLRIPHWRDALADCLERLKPQK